MRDPLPPLDLRRMCLSPEVSAYYYTNGFVPHVEPLGMYLPPMSEEEVAALADKIRADVDAEIMGDLP